MVTIPTKLILKISQEDKSLSKSPEMIVPLHVLCSLFDADHTTEMQLHVPQKKMQVVQKLHKLKRNDYIGRLHFMLVYKRRNPTEV